MKRIVCLIVSLALALSLTACSTASNSTANHNTPESSAEMSSKSKSDELNEKYSFYEKTVKEISKKMEVTQEQANEIFIILVECGLNQKPTYIIGKNGDYTVDFGKIGEGVTNLYVKVENGVVTEVKNGLTIVFPNQPSESDGKLSSSDTNQEETSTPESTATSKVESSAPSVPESIQTESNFTVTTPPQSSSTTTPSTSQSKPSVVYIAASGNGTKFHKSPNCSKMNGNVIEMTRDEAEAAGYTPCKKNSCYG